MSSNPLTYQLHCNFQQETFMFNNFSRKQFSTSLHRPEELLCRIADFCTCSLNFLSRKGRFLKKVHLVEKSSTMPRTKTGVFSELVSLGFSTNHVYYFVCKPMVLKFGNIRYYRKFRNIELDMKNCDVSVTLYLNFVNNKLKIRKFSVLVKNCV